MKNLVQMGKFQTVPGFKKNMWSIGVPQFDAGAKEWCFHSSATCQKFITNI